MNYEAKLKECSRRVYGCNHSQKPKSTRKLEMMIDRDDDKIPKFDMNEDVDSLILTAADYFWLPSYMADRTKLIMAKMWSSPDIFHDIKYENAILGVLMYVIYEFAEGITVNLSEFCAKMFGTSRSRRNITQMYKAYGIVCDLY